MKKGLANLFASVIRNKQKRRLVRDILTNKIIGKPASCTGIDDSVIPAIEPNVVATTKKRAPYGKRKAAILTNMLLDWQTGEPRFGGGERYALNVARLLKELGFEVHFYQTAFREFTGEYYGFPVYVIPMAECYSEFDYGICDQFYELTKDYDHVYYNTPEYSSGKMRSDAIMTCHGIWFDHNNYGPAVKFRSHEWFRQLGKTFSQPRKIVSVDTTSIDTIRTFWPELTSNMTFIPNFVDTEVFKPDHSKRSAEKLRVLIPRRSHVNRGSRILGDMLKAIPHDVEIHWVGEGNAQDTEIIKGLARKDARLHYHAATFDEMPEWYQKCDISVIPTIACEGTSLSLIESLACGCATITTHIGGLSDLVIDGYNGIMTDPTAEQLAFAINKLIEDKELRLKYQQKGLESAAHFALNNWRKKWINVLLEQDWISKEQALRSGLISEKELIVPAPRKDLLILTRNAIHGGVESLIQQELKYLNAEVVVCGGVDHKSTTPFAYTRADNKTALLHKLVGYEKVLYHWIPDYALEAVKESGAKCVEFVHRDDVNNCNIPMANAYVTHSPFLAEYAKKMTRKDCTVVSHPIDTEKFTPAEKQGAYIGGITTYNTLKGIDRFIRAWADLRLQFPNVKARFYGQGGDIEKFKQLSDELRADVEFLPATTEPHMALRDFQCVVSPSRIEGLPVAILESLAMNIPVIASDLSGMVEFNQLAETRGFSGIMKLFKQGDLSDFKKQIIDVLSSDTKSNSREYIRQYYNPQSHCEMISAVFNSMK